MNSETGVGKTKLLHVYSQIINARLQHNMGLHGTLRDALQLQTAAIPHNAVQNAAALQQACACLAGLPLNTTDGASLLQALLHVVAYLAGYVAVQVPGQAQMWQAQDEVVVTDPHTCLSLLSQIKGIIKEHVINQPILHIGQFIYVHSVLIARGIANQASRGEQIADAAKEAAAQWHLLPQREQDRHEFLGQTDAFKHGQGPLASAFALTTAAIIADFSSFAALLAAVAAALVTETHPMLTVLPMHAKVDQQHLANSLQPVIALARSCPKHTFTFFEDELNTSTIIGPLKDMFTDHCFLGQQLPSNIFLVAAVNPFRPKAAQAVADGSQSWDSSYNVRALPDSMLELVWDFGCLSVNQERSYIAAKLGLIIAQGPSNALLGKLQDVKLAGFITKAQVSIIA